MKHGLDFTAASGITGDIDPVIFLGVAGGNTGDFEQHQHCGHILGFNQLGQFLNRGGHFDQGIDAAIEIGCPHLGDDAEIIFRGAVILFTIPIDSGTSCIQNFFAIHDYSLLFVIK